MSYRIAKNLSYLHHFKKINLNAENIECLFTTKCFKNELLKQIKMAKERIYISALYLENDEAGREILELLYKVKNDIPEIDIVLCIDFHRAQRGLIGLQGAEDTNAIWYQSMAKANGLGIKIVGVPVKRKEIFGVQHLKGFILDQKVLYSGASLNNIYLNQCDRFRLDRYWLIENKQLADSMVDFIKSNVLDSNATPLLNAEFIPKISQLKTEHKKFVSQLKRAKFQFEDTGDNGSLSVTPLSGLGARDNQLNKTIRSIFQSTEKELVLFTPYFNLPLSFARDLNAILKRNVKVTIVVGDKTANDFFIPEDQKFSTIGGLPYLYETNLRHFAQKHASSINNGQLNIHLWKKDENSFHLKGIYSDNKFILLTGHNLNPRALRLDLENGLLIHDPKQELKSKLDIELSLILEDTKKINDYTDIDDLKNYPIHVQKLLSRLSRVQADKIVKGII